MLYVFSTVAKEKYDSL